MDEGVRIRFPQFPRHITLDLVDKHVPVDDADAVFFTESLDADYILFPIGHLFLRHLCASHWENQWFSSSAIVT